MLERLAQRMVHGGLTQPPTENGQITLHVLIYR